MSKNESWNSSTPKAVQDCHELLLWLIPLLDKFPRNRRFTLGERLETVVLDVLALLVDAAWSREKRESLTNANRKLEIARHLWRLCFELQLRLPAGTSREGQTIILE